MKILDISEDCKRKCLSVVTKMTLKEYYDLAKDSFDENGSLDGQRGVIKKSAAAARIRKRMHEDFNKGAIFPQVVIGVIQSIDEFKNYTIGDKVAVDIFKDRNVSIIDGMQRSNIYFSNFDGNEDREIRVEFWMADDSVQLLYRMLVLNTGQTPWNTRRQVEVVFANIAKSIQDELYVQYPDYKEAVKLAQIDDNKKRTQAGIYPLNSVIEMYLGFNTRNVKVQVSDELSEEYQRFDMMESIEMNDSLKYFVTSFGLMCKLDFCLAENVSMIEDKEAAGRLTSFSSTLVHSRTSTIVRPAGPSDRAFQKPPCVECQFTHCSPTVTPAGPVETDTSKRAPRHGTTVTCHCALPGPCQGGGAAIVQRTPHPVVGSDAVPDRQG